MVQLLANGTPSGLGLPGGLFGDVADVLGNLGAIGQPTLRILAARASIFVSAVSVLW